MRHRTKQLGERSFRRALGNLFSSQVPTEGKAKTVPTATCASERVASWKMQKLGKAKADGDKKRVEEWNPTGQDFSAIYTASDFRRRRLTIFGRMGKTDFRRSRNQPTPARSFVPAVYCRGCGSRRRNRSVGPAVDPSERKLEHDPWIIEKLPIDLDELERSHQHGWHSGL